MKIALLISTYNWPQALSVVLKSLQLQTAFPQEVLIADDGSAGATRDVIEQFQRKLDLEIKHFWQEDKGFRKSAILNKAVAGTDADYIIQIDGDCIMHPYFIEDHISRIQDNVYLFGSRVNLKPSAVPDILKNEVTDFSMFSKSVLNKTRNMRIPVLRDLYKEKNTFSHKTRGCNISYWRRDFLAVNGYDETMEGWGREDSEFVLRMLNNDVKGKRLRYGGIVYHIYHQEKSKAHLLENTRIQEDTIREKKVWCSKGVDKYLS